MIVLDTNVISALMQPALNRQVVDWLDQQPRASIWTTAVNILELRSGILLLPEGRRRSGLVVALDRLVGDLMEERVLPFDLDAAEEAARIVAARVPNGLNIGTRDTQIAAIVASRGAALATRNVRHFADLTIRLINPWET